MSRISTGSFCRRGHVFARGPREVMTALRFSEVTGARYFSRVSRKFTGSVSKIEESRRIYVVDSKPAAAELLRESEPVDTVSIIEEVL